MAGHFPLDFQLCAGEEGSGPLYQLLRLQKQGAAPKLPSDSQYPKGVRAEGAVALAQDRAGGNEPILKREARTPPLLRG